MSTYIKFHGPYSSATGKTSIWEVIPKDADHTRIGEVRWFGRWRKYAFFPLSETVFEQVCLRDIADFCETKTKEHKQRKK
ncbi:hypothetical protein LCGC14_1230900 [marine sediment metagenome]|uniref:Uncharacterized protein n=1 Tax=marine sediment metagenome TaxID=412755 RepID=A0A0F9LCP1_9ZZZZ